jgi:CDP-paratose 2-epimerase
MAVAVITGSSGLIGSESARFFHERGFDVLGIDNNMRQVFFGADGSVEWNTQRLRHDLRRFRHVDLDIRDREGIDGLFRELGRDVVLVIHAAAQPSHDWAAREPFTDFSINAMGTLVLLEATRQYAPEAAFIFTSTNKVYGDTPNRLPLVEEATRWEIDRTHRYAAHGIDESMSIDESMHSLFGVSKVAADVMTQEYGRYFGLKTGVFRGGCLTGPAHSGAELHGFLAYLVKCAVTGRPYTVYGYKGKQVRDNIHSYDLVNAFWHFFQAPRTGAVYNMGGSRHANCSVLEAARLTERLCGRQLNVQISDQARAGDHIWWVSDVRRFQRDYPEWAYRYGLGDTVAEIVDAVQVGAGLWRAR